MSLTKGFVISSPVDWLQSSTSGFFLHSIQSTLGRLCRRYAEFLLAAAFNYCASSFFVFGVKNSFTQICYLFSGRRNAWIGS